MPVSILHHAMNVGVVDRNKLHRVDLARMRLAAEQQTNIMPLSVGPGMFRAGTRHLAASKGNNKPWLLPFIAGEDAAYLLEFTDGYLRVLDDDVVITRPAVTSTVTNGDFASGAGWTLAATSGQTSTVTGGELQLSARAHGGKASCKQLVTTSTPNVEHALRVVVTRGPVTFRVGSTDGGDEYVRETYLATWEHSLAFVPTGSYYVQFTTTDQVIRKVTSCTVEAAGVMELPTPWVAASLPKLNPVQSLDVMFMACAGVRPMRIERRGEGGAEGRSWSVCNYAPNDGPFNLSKSADLKLTPSVTEGNGTLTASAPFFKSTHVGALFKIYHEGQKVETFLAGANEYTPTFMVTGINETDYNERDFTTTIAGTWVGTLRHQRSFDGEDIEFHNFRRERTSAVVDITANATFTNDDNDDNAIAWYRVGFEDATYTSGEASVNISYDGGGGFGICRIIGFTSSTVVDIEVLTPFKGKHASNLWNEGAWSGVQGYPSGVALHEGRLWWVGSDQVWGSISDAFDSFDEDFIGDSAPLQRSIALGGRNEGRWMIPLSTLLIGTDARIANAPTLPMTQDNFGIRSLGKVGAASVPPVEVTDDRALFVQNAGTAMYECSFVAEKGKFLATQFSKLTTDLYASGITQLAVQNRPDQRIWTVMDDDDAVCTVFEPAQEVVASVPISTSSATDFIESIAVLPAFFQDQVYFAVKRVVNGSTVHYIEKMARDDEAVPDDICKVLDSHVTFGAGSATVNLPHLIGRTVRVWMDGAPVNNADGSARDFVVSGGGTITLPSVPATGGCAGRPSRGRYKSARRADGDGGSTSMLKKKTLARVGLMLGDYCRSGIQVGRAFDDANHPLRDLPSIVNGTTPTEVVSGPGPDEDLSSPVGSISFDERLCIEFNSPKPATVLALVMEVETYGN